MPSTKVKYHCQCCGGFDDVRYMELFGIMSANICKRCRIHFCISEKEARRGRIDSISKDDRWREGLRAAKDAMS